MNISARHFKYPLVFLMFSAFFSAPVPATADLNFSLGSEVHLQADTIEYLKDQNLIMARGRVHIRQGLVHLYADSIRYDVQAQDIQAQGQVVWQDDKQEIVAESLSYNLKTRAGKAVKIRTVTPPWLCFGSEIEITPKKIIIKDAVTTTCDYAEGYRHYQLKAGKITIYSGDFLVAENVVLYIGKVPVFYFPFFVRTIHEIKTPFSLSTGSTEYLGNYLLLTTHYLFSPESYGAVYTDYFFKKGLGLGIRHEIALSDYSVLSLYGYGIQESDTPRYRWESRVQGLWAISSSLQGRVEADLPGDGFFSTDYSVARRDASLISSVRDYNVSMTLTRPRFTLTVLFRQEESADVSQPERFIKNSQQLPLANFTLFSQPLIGKNWIMFDLRAQGEHTYTKANDYFVNHFSGEMGLSQSLLFLQSHTLSTRAAFSARYQDVSDVGLENAGETHSINTGNNWTGRWTEFLTSTFAHSYTQKLNHLLATDPADGIQANLLTGSLDFHSGSLLRARTSTSYDFLAKVPTTGAHFSYLYQELYVTPSPRFNFIGTMNYSIQANAIKDVNTVFNVNSARDFWRFRVSGLFVDPNVSNTGFVSPGGQPANFQISGEVSFAFFTNYRISALETYDLTNAKFLNRSINLYRDLHDWEAQLSYSEDPVAGKKIFFTLNLKAFPGRPLTVSEDQLQRLNGLRNQGLTGAASQFQ
jgi:lipopolysaccharide assembly outer membrane protein LptD (OstA)